MVGLFQILIFVIIILFFSGIIRFVPANTVYIIDRNSHYLKTKKSGLFFFWPATDKITTKISINHLYKYYTNAFETHDGKIVRVDFNVEYHAENLEAVLTSLESVRRSVNDIMNSSVYWAVHALNISDFYNKPDLLKNEILPKLTAEATELSIVVDKFNLTSIVDVSFVQNIVPFKPHLSSYNSGPIKFN